METSMSITVATSMPNTYEAPSCQETDCPSERTFAFFPPGWSWHSRPQGPCADCISLYAVQTAHVWPWP